jgi:hypothetical protein
VTHFPVELVVRDTTASPKVEDVPHVASARPRRFGLEEE